MSNDDIPGQPFDLQSCCFVNSPMHSLPHFRDCCSTVLVETWVPPPQLTVQDPHAVHSPNLQSDVQGSIAWLFFIAVSSSTVPNRNFILRSICSKFLLTLNLFVFHSPLSEDMQAHNRCHGVLPGNLVSFASHVAGPPLFIIWYLPTFSPLLFLTLWAQPPPSKACSSPKWDFALYPRESIIHWHFSTLLAASRI